MVESRWAMTKVVRPLHQVAQALLDQRLGFGVEAGGGFVQDQNARIGQNGARDGDALALPPESLTPRSPTMVS